MRKFPIIMGILVVGTIVLLLLIKNISRVDFRPEHCIDKKCADKDVFSELPPYPKNLKEIALGVKLNVYNLPENFSLEYPDEYYYKQPEFYPDDSFVKEGLKYYTVSNLKFDAGSGCYPSDILISNMGNKDLIKVNDTVRAITYWHSGYAIQKYQVFKLVPTFPENMSMRMETYKVEQDPEEARRCLDVKIYPENVILDPTYPKFGYNWSQKIEAYITIKCTGKFGIEVVMESPDPSLFVDIIKEKGLFAVSGSIVGSNWNIFVEVQ